MSKSPPWVDSHVNVIISQERKANTSHINCTNFKLLYRCPCRICWNYSSTHSECRRTSYYQQDGLIWQKIQSQAMFLTLFNKTIREDYKNPIFALHAYAPVGTFSLISCSCWRHRLLQSSLSYFPSCLRVSDTLISITIINITRCCTTSWSPNYRISDSCGERPGFLGKSGFDRISLACEFQRHSARPSWRNGSKLTS